MAFGSKRVVFDQKWPFWNKITFVVDFFDKIVILGFNSKMNKKIKIRIPEFLSYHLVITNYYGAWPTQNSILIKWIFECTWPGTALIWMHLSKWTTRTWSTS